MFDFSDFRAPHGRRLLIGTAGWLAAAGAARAAGPTVQPMLNDPPPDEEALARKARSIAALRAAGIPVLESLPTLPSAARIRQRSRMEVEQRCKCLAAVGVTAEEASAGAQAMQRLGLRMKDFTPDEQAFLQAGTRSQRERARFGWQYECLAVLMWTLGTWTLEPPADIVDVPGLVRAVIANYAPGPAKGQPRPFAEVLDMADLVYRQHWAARNASVTGKPPVPGLNEEVLLERHRALGWLIRNGAWDDVDVST